MKHEALTGTALSRFILRLTRHSQLGEHEREALSSLTGKVVQFRAGNDFPRKGLGVQQVGLVVEGIVAGFEENEEGRRQVSSLFVPGDMCDLVRLICPQTALRLSAYTHCSVLHIPLEELRQIVALHPNLERVFWKDTAIDVSIAGKWIGNLSLRSGASRAAHLVCELGLRMEAAGLASRTSFILEVTQNRLAEAVGLTPVHMNRVLQHLRGEGVILPSSRGVWVKDWERLCDIAKFDATYLHLPPNGYDYATIAEASFSRDP